MDIRHGNAVLFNTGKMSHVHHLLQAVVPHNILQHLFRGEDHAGNEHFAVLWNLPHEIIDFFQFHPIHFHDSPTHRG
jgi:hypothetical protein